MGAVRKFSFKLPPAFGEGPNSSQRYTFSLSCFILRDPCYFALVFAVLFFTCTVGMGESSGRIAVHIDSLANMGSRVMGYQGAETAADYLQRNLRASGVEEVYMRPFQVPTPVDEGAGLVLLEQGRSLELYHRWPNLVRTSTLPEKGIEARLVYGGRAGPGELDGLEIAGNIVALEYNCGRNWVLVFELGAAAVIFLEPLRTHRKEGEDKFLTTPADLPRFYASGETERVLRRELEKGEPTVRIWGRMSWRSAPARTEVGIIPGSDAVLGNEAVMIGAVLRCNFSCPGAGARS